MCVTKKGKAPGGRPCAWRALSGRCDRLDRGKVVLGGQGRSRQIMGGLKIDPELRGRPEDTPQPERGVRRDRLLLADQALGAVVPPARRATLSRRNEAWGGRRPPETREGATPRSPRTSPPHPGPRGPALKVSPRTRRLRVAPSPRRPSARKLSQTARSPRWLLRASPPRRPVPFEVSLSGPSRRLRQLESDPSPRDAQQRGAEPLWSDAGQSGAEAVDNPACG